MISGQVPNHLVYGARAGFLQALNTGTPQWARIANVINMDRKSVDLVDLGAAPMPKNSNSGMTIQDFVEQSMTVKPLDWDITVFITDNAMKDDQTGTLERRVRGAGQNFQKHMNKMIFSALNVGDVATYGLAYDGQYFFDTDHVDKGASYNTNQSNKNTVALTLDNFETAWVAASTFLDDTGEVSGFMPSLLVVPPALKREAAQIADNREAYDVANRAINPFAGEVSYIVSPYLDSTSWYLLSANEAIKPLFLVMREQPYLQDAWFDPAKPDGGHWNFKFFARYNVAYGNWRLAYQGNS